MSKRVITPEDLLQLRSVTSPALSSNGEQLVFVETTLHNEKNTYAAELMKTTLTGSEAPVQLTQGDTSIGYHDGHQKKRFSHSSLTVQEHHRYLC